MRQARSLFLAGQLIDCEDSNHQDYFHKGLICPFCLDKVFYCQGFARQAQGKIINISPSFKHHKGDPLSCEARARSREGQEILRELNPQAREQRKPIWQKYFWSIFKAGFEANFPYPDLAKVILNHPVNARLPDYAMHMNGKRVHIGQLGYILFLCLGPGSGLFSPEKNLEKFSKLSQALRDIFYSDDFRRDFKINSHPALHHAVCLEILQALNSSPSLNHITIRIMILILLCPSDQLWQIPQDALNTLMGMTLRVDSLTRKYGASALSEDDLATDEELLEIQSIFLPLYLQIIGGIDWYSLSKFPWHKKRIDRKDRILLLPENRGKGFG